MRDGFFCVAIILGLWGLGWAQGPNAQQWHKMVDDQKCEEARRFCTELTNSGKVQDESEGHKCLANVALCKRDVVTLQATDDGGGVMSSGYMPEAVDESLEHLNAALKLTPQDISIHQGRLHMLEISQRFDEMAEALADTCVTYKGMEGADPWLAYISELFDMRQYKAALKLAKVLEKHYPNDHEVIGNVGAVHSVLRDDAEALKYLKRAVELAPEDPIDTWNLGRLYDFMNKTDLADQWYQKALRLEKNTDQLKTNSCIYGSFLEKKTKQVKRACEIEKKYCDTEEQTACKR
jgi:tetratricopeptide (TPR) repeat protein